MVVHLVLQATPAGAQTTPPDGQPIVQSWAVAPSGDDPSQPGARTDLSYQLDPGATIHDSVTVFNYGNVQMNLRLYATDAYNTASGEFALLEGDKPPTDAGTWVTLPQQYVTVPASSSIVVPITITVPQNASAGDHSGAIVASSVVSGANDSGQQVALDRRTGTRLYVRVAGPVNPVLVVEHVSARYSGGALDPVGGTVHVTYTVRNAGNVRLAAHQSVSVKGFALIGVKDAKLADLPELLPGNSVTLTADLKQVVAAVRLNVDVRVTPFTSSPGLTGTLTTFHSAAHVWAIPWSLVIVTALVVGWWKWVRRSRQRRPVPVRPTTTDVKEPVVV